MAWNQIEVDSGATLDVLGGALRQVTTAPGTRIRLMSALAS